MSRQSPNGTYWKKRALAAEKDAARWRWWRKWWANKADDMERINDAQGHADTADELDAAVDNAIDSGVQAKG